MNVVFPKQVTNPTYYRIHVRYLIQLFKAMPCSISFIDKNMSIDNSKFLVMIDGLPVLFDFCDFSCETTNWGGAPYFKLHYDYRREYADNVVPFPPVSFYNWTQYELKQESIKYSASGVISYRQRPYGGATERRLKLRSILDDACKNMLETQILPQNEYWQSIQHDFVQIFAPGAREGILDRAQLQCMAFGECTISPFITDTLLARALIPDEHYIMCSPDFSDVPAILDELLQKPHICVAVGKNAKRLFRETCSPKVVRDYVKGVMA